MEEQALETVRDLGIERKNVEINELKKEIECTSELYNAEVIIVNALEKTLHKMDTVQSQILVDHARQIGKLKFSILMKNKKKKELKELSKRIRKD